MTRARRAPRTLRRRILAGLLLIGVTVASLIVMINFVLPWAAQTLVADFVSRIQAP